MRLDRRVARMLVSLASVAVAALVVAGASPRALAQTAPAADLAVTGYSDRHVSLSWTDTSGGLTGFDLQRRTLDGEFASIALLPMGTALWTDDTVAAETSYEYEVIAVLDGVPAEFNPTVIVTTLPAPPAGFGIAAIAQREVTLSWTDPSGGLSDFEIQKRVPGGVFETVAMAAAGTTEWTDLDVLPESDYEYRVRAVHDGIPSLFTSVVTVSTLPIPAPNAPGSLVAGLLSPTSVSLSWTDLSADEIQFQVFRGMDGGMPVLVKSLPADATSWIDEGIAAERTYSYTVRAVGAVGPSSPSAAAVVQVPASFTLQVLKGKRVDSARASKDSLDVTLGCTSLGGVPLPDPRLATFSLGSGPAGGPALVSLPAGEAGWKVRNGVYTWKSPKGSFVKATLVVDTVKGTIRFKAARLQLDGVDAAAVRVWFRCGVEAGSETAAWTAKRAGTLVR